MAAWLRPALPAWVASRLGLLGLSFFAAGFGDYMLGHRASALRVWLQWDTGWYLHISQAGYAERESANFFPLFPALVEAGSALLLHPHAAADSSLRLGVALVLASALALVALAAVAALAGEVVPGLEERAALALAAFPTAFFLTAAYSEAPFVALAALSLLLGRRGRWIPAAACALLAGLTRSAAVILVLPLAWEALRQARGRHRRLLVAALVAGMAAAPLAGIAAYAVYLGARFGDPLLFAHTQTQLWHHQALWPWDTARLVAGRFLEHRAGLLPVELGLWLAAVAALAWGVRRLPLSYTLLSAGALAIAVAAPTPGVNDALASAGRYTLAAAPLFVVVAGWMRTSRYFESAYLFCALLLQAGLLITFLLGGPVM